MNTEELEQRLRQLPLETPNPAREATLLVVLRQAAGPCEPATPWWRRPIPLWQAAAAIVALVIVDTAWLRPPHRLPADGRDGRVVALRIDTDFFARSKAAGEPLDVVRWTSHVVRAQ